MRGVLAFLNFCVLLRASAGQVCTKCPLRACPPVPAQGCEEGRVLARDPCGCCDQCARLELELCGGENWQLGYCNLGLTCSALNHTGAVTIPDIGVCKSTLDTPDTGVEDEQCPISSGCNLVNEECVCESKHSCLISFSYPNPEVCAQAMKREARHHEEEHMGMFVVSSNPACIFSGCNLTTTGCECVSQSCHQHFTYANHSQCQLATVSTKCVHNGTEFTEAEVYHMDPCWLCQCRGGISFCSKTECAKLECDNFYIPEGECCPICTGVELLSANSNKASCWVYHKLRQHEEQWKEDDCTFCQCVDGESHCTAMVCKQNCHNPVKIPGECCPFCEEPSYETVSPLLCPPLENCSMSGHECPFGFQQDQNGCLLCQCLSNDTCPKLSSYCNRQCPMGYEKDNYGCEVCQCSTPSECKPMICRKTCPYGYVRNKHSCEMCRCIKCPPFTCDKQCSDGYKQNKKGCNVCLCKERSRSVSTTASPALSSYCLTASGQRFEEGEGWHDGCRDCYCHAGHEMCVLISCSAPSCTNPVLRSHQCCPSCEEELGSGHPGMDMVVCQAPGDELYVEGDTWNLDECTRCTCRQGRVLCDTEVCPPALCQTPTRTKGTCCHICQEDTFRSFLPVDNQREYCISSDGDVLLSGDSWKPNACTSCICNSGTIQCFSQRCPAANCKVPVLRKGQCCPQCLDITTTSLPVMTTSTSKLSTTGISEHELWIPQHTVVPVTDDRSLNGNIPDKVEVIYQSAAWILAALLMSIVIFFIVAFLINKRKNCIQMSCYNAPKKSVILKKHVNKNSVVSAEPLKENKPQSGKNDCRITISPSTSLTYGERISIPRAKLSNGHVRVQR